MSNRDPDMSETIVDMAKVTAAMDAGWQFLVFKGGMDTYCVICHHANDKVFRKRKNLLDEDGELVTDDFTAAQAMTRAAYKVMEGRII